MRPDIRNRRRRIPVRERRRDGERRYIEVLRDALLKQKQQPLKRQLAIFVLDDPEPMLWGSEPIYRDGQPVGYTTSGSYGHTVGGAIAMGYVTNPAGVNADFIKSGRFEINVSGERFAARAYLRPPYDPERKRILA